MDSFFKSVFVKAGKHTSVHDVHPHFSFLYFVVVIVGELGGPGDAIADLPGDTTFVIWEHPLIFNTIK